ncbi:TetR/AcrR family transcriptional regulator [Mesorhizobium sp. M0019]
MVGDIAQASGLTRPTLYLTFPDKERVFEAVVETMISVAAPPTAASSV